MSELISSLRQLLQEQLERRRQRGFLEAAMAACALVARTTARAMNRQFSNQGGSRYLRKLFSEGPVAQGSRLASLRTPAYATDNSFGTTY